MLYEKQRPVSSFPFRFNASTALIFFFSVEINKGLDWEFFILLHFNITVCTMAATCIMSDPAEPVVGAPGV